MKRLRQRAAVSKDAPIFKQPKKGDEDGKEEADAQKLVSLGLRDNCIREGRQCYAIRLPNKKECRQPILPLVDSSKEGISLVRDRLLTDGYVFSNLGDGVEVSEALLALKRVLLDHESVRVEKRRKDKGQDDGLGVLRIGEEGLYGIDELPCVTHLIKKTIKGLAAVLPPGQVYIMQGQSYTRRISSTRFTQAHHDHAYLKTLGGLARIADDERISCLTVWRPLNETCFVGHGVLALMPGSHLRLAENTPEAVKRAPSWYSGFREKLPLSYFYDAQEMPWHIGSYAAGDVVLFDARTVHCASVNETQRCRYSLDFRLVVKPFDYTPDWWDDEAVQEGLEEVRE